jgi:hypothetical protein
VIAKAGLRNNRRGRAEVEGRLRALFVEPIAVPLHQGARIIKRHDGATPEPPKD